MIFKNYNQFKILFILSRLQYIEKQTNREILAFLIINFLKFDSAATKAMDVGLSTTGQSDAQKMDAWKGYGYQMLSSTITSGLSVAASAAGGAISRATGSLGTVASSILSTVASSAISTIGGYGINMGISAIRYAAGDMSAEQLQELAITGAITSGISFASSVALTGITSGIS